MSDLEFEFGADPESLKAAAEIIEAGKAHGVEISESRIVDATEAVDSATVLFATVLVAYKPTLEFVKAVWPILKHFSGSKPPPQHSVRLETSKMKIDVTSTSLEAAMELFNAAKDATTPQIPLRRDD